MSTRTSDFWASYVDSWRDQEVDIQCRPSSIIGTALTVGAFILACRYVPHIYELTKMPSVTAPLVFLAVATLFSWLAYFWKALRKSKSLIALAIWMDTTMYGATCIATAALCEPYISYSMAMIWLIFCVYYGVLFSFSISGALSILTGPLFAAYFVGADSFFYLLLGLSVLTFVIISRNTYERRRQMGRSQDVLLSMDEILEQAQQSLLEGTEGIYSLKIHRIKNILSPAVMGLDTLRLSRRNWSRDDLEVFEEMRDSLNDTVKELTSLMSKMRPKGKSIFTAKDLYELLCRYTLRGGGVSIRNEAPSETEILGSMELLSLALENLVNNATEAGAHKIEMFIGLSANKQNFRLSIADDAGGLPQAVVQRLFEPFVKTSKATGTGCGIYLSQKAIESMGGAIRYSPLRDGSLFEIILSLKKDGNGAVNH